ncbi:MAG: ABC transporter permease [Actinomycetia bacterium]|nr:ABC transporter permease [Actinomycetes bacterium]
MNVVSETLTITQRNLTKSVRVPILLFMSLFQPLLFLVLFSQIFSSLANLPGFPYDSYLQFLVPAIIAMTALSSAFQSGLGTVADIEDGMLDKFLIAPIYRVSIMAGRILADGIRIIAQAGVVILAAFAMGARYETGLVGIAMMIFLASIFGMAWAGLSNIVALRTQNAEVTMVIGIVLLFPILFLSTGFMPAALLPDWLDTVARFNPLTYLIDAERALVNDGWDWNLILQSIGVTLLLGAVTLTAATRAFRKAIS